LRCAAHQVLIDAAKSAAADIIFDRDEALVERAFADAAELRPLDHAIAFS
jgi:hypothetical protein